MIEDATTTRTCVTYKSGEKSEKKLVGKFECNNPFGGPRLRGGEGAEWHYGLLPSNVKGEDRNTQKTRLSHKLLLFFLKMRGVNLKFNL
jgi:hypothetical protein